MAIRIMSLDRTWEYTLEEDRASESPTVFVLRRLTWEQMQEVNALSPYLPSQLRRIELAREAAKHEERELSEEEIQSILTESGRDERQVAVAITRMYACAVRLGLKEVRNVADENGQPISIGADDFVKAASTGMLRELGEQIIAGSRLSEESGKN